MKLKVKFNQFKKTVLNRTFKNTSALFALVLLATAVFSQTISTNIDSLKNLLHTTNGIRKVNLLKEISVSFWNSNIDSSIYYAEKALLEAKKDGSDAALGDAYNNLANAYAIENKFDVALKYYLKSKEYRERNGNPSKIADTYYNLGLLYSDQKKLNDAITNFEKAAEYYSKANDYESQLDSYNRIISIYTDINNKNKALEYSFKTLSIANAHNLDDKKANIYNRIGSLNRLLKNFDLAEKYYSLAFKEWEKSNNLYGMQSAYNNLGIIYDEKGQVQKALEYYNKSLELAIKLKDSSGIATAYNNIGYLNSSIKEYESALTNYYKSLKISEATNQKDAIFNTLNNIAAIYLKKNNLTLAQKTLKRVLTLIKDVKEISYKQETHQLLSELYRKKGDFKKAYYHKNIELAYTDSLYTQQQIASITEMQTRYETEAKEKEIELLKKDVELKELQYKQQKNVQQVLISLTLLLAIIFIVTTLVLYIIRKKNRQLAEKNKELNIINTKLKESEANLKELNLTKDKLFTIIAHDLKNPFNALIGFSDILERNYHHLTDNEKKEYISVISESSQNLYKLLENLLQWTRTQTGSINYIPEIFKLEPIINQEISTLSANAEKKNIVIKTNYNLNKSVFADKNSIATVIRNLLSNAIKFTNIGGKVEVTLRESTDEPKKAEVIIKDSGVGISKEDLDKIFLLDGSHSTKGTANESGTGLGLLLCHEFVTKNNGKIWVKSTRGKGSEFHFTLPTA